MARSELPRDRQILDAAAELFYERGFAATGVADIGKHVGVSGPALYSHFSSKEEILTKLAIETIDRLGQVPSDPLDDPALEIDRLIRHHVAVMLADRKHVSVYMRESRSLAESSRERIDRRVQAHFDRWVEALARRWPAHDRATLVTAANSALGIANSIILWRDEAMRTPDLPELLVEMTAAALNILDAPPVEAI